MPPEKNNNELASLEDDPTTVSASPVQSAPSASSELNESVDQQEAPTPNAPKIGLRERIRRWLSRFNIYLLAFILLLLITGIAAYVAYRQNQAANTDLTTQQLSDSTLEQLQNSDVKVGDPKQTLSIEANAIFSGKVLVRDSLDVAGAIKVGGALSLPGITVSGTSSFEQVQASGLIVAGDTNVQGQVNVQKNLNVTGSGSFGGTLSAGQLSVQTLQLNGDFQLNRHFDPTGGSPSKSDGNALGSGGTASVSGTDTAGTVTINTGGGPATGCFVTLTFTQKFNGTPHVVITPIGSGAAGLNYYVNRSNTSFSICSTNAAGGSQSFSFDYIVMD